MPAVQQIAAVRALLDEATPPASTPDDLLERLDRRAQLDWLAQLDRLDRITGDDQQARIDALRLAFRSAARN